MGTLPRSVLLLALPVFGARGFAQLHSPAASVPLSARIEESVSLSAFQIPHPAGLRASGEPTQEVFQVMLDWRLQEGRSYRISCAIEVSSEVSAPPPNPKFFALGQLERETLAFSFLPKTHDQPMFLGVWGQTQPEPTGAAGLLLGLPSLAPSAERTLRITLAVL